jgi:hypothetical protein
MGLMRQAGWRPRTDTTRKALQPFPLTKLSLGWVIPRDLSSAASSGGLVPCLVLGRFDGVQVFRPKVQMLNRIL